MEQPVRNRSADPRTRARPAARCAHRSGFRAGNDASNSPKAATNSPAATPGPVRAARLDIVGVDLTSIFESGDARERGSGAMRKTGCDEEKEAAGQYRL